MVKRTRVTARAIELQPTTVQALSNRGALLLTLRQYEEAERCLQRANELQPGAATGIVQYRIVTQIAR